MKTKRKPVKRERPTLAQYEHVLRNYDKLQRDFDSFKAIHDVLLDDARKGIGLNGVSPPAEIQGLQAQIGDLVVRLADANDRAASHLNLYLRTNSELLDLKAAIATRPWWKKLLGIRT